MDGINILSLDSESEILDMVEGNIFVYSVDGVCLYANKCLADALGFDPTNKHLSDIFPHKSQKSIEGIISDYKKLRKNKEMSKLVNQEKISNGEERFFSVTRKPIYWKDCPAIIGIGKDITDIFLMQKELGDANDKLKKFVSHVAHDIKSPVATIIGYMSLIDKYMDNPQNNIIKINKFLDVIENSADRIQDFVANLIEYMKLDKGVVSKKIEQIDLNRFLNDFKEQQFGYIININNKLKAIGKNSKDITINIDEGISQIKGDFESDKGILENIFSNLISNAIKFTDNGFIKISAEIKSDFIVFSVSDTGIGIAKEDLDLIFQEFRSAERSTYESAIKGTGLGLSIVKLSVESLGGKMLHVQSELGKGTVFSFELPLKKQA